MDSYVISWSSIQPVSQTVWWWISFETSESKQASSAYTLPPHPPTHKRGPLKIARSNSECKNFSPTPLSPLPSLPASLPLSPLEIKQRRGRTWTAVTVASSLSWKERSRAFTYTRPISAALNSRFSCFHLPSMFCTMKWVSLINLWSNCCGRWLST